MAPTSDQIRGMVLNIFSASQETKMFPVYVFSLAFLVTIPFMVAAFLEHTGKIRRRVKELSPLLYRSERSIKVLFGSSGGLMPPLTYTKLRIALSDVCVVRVPGISE